MGKGRIRVKGKRGVYSMKLYQWSSLGNSFEGSEEGRKIAENGRIANASAKDCGKEV